MSSAKKIGLFACTGVVAGNMMGPEKFPLHLVFRQVFFITMLTGLVTWQLVLPLYLIFPPSSQY